MLAAGYSPIHGEAYILSEDPIQLGESMLINIFDESSGIIVIIKDDTYAVVIKETVDHESMYFDFCKRPISKIGELFRELNLNGYGILLDCGIAEDGRRKYKVISDVKNII